MCASVCILHTPDTRATMQNSLSERLLPADAHKSLLDVFVKGGAAEIDHKDNQDNEKVRSHPRFM